MGRKRIPDVEDVKLCACRDSRETRLLQGHSRCATVYFAVKSHCAQPREPDCRCLRAAKQAGVEMPPTLFQLRSSAFFISTVSRFFYIAGSSSSPAEPTDILNMNSSQTEAIEFPPKNARLPRLGQALRCPGPKAASHESVPGIHDVHIQGAKASHHALGWTGLSRGKRGKTPALASHLRPTTFSSASSSSSSPRRNSSSYST